MPYVRVGLLLPGITTSEAYVSFLVDTGAMVTCLAPVTAVSPVGMPIDWFVRPHHVLAREPVSGIGGETYQFIVRAQYVFAHEDGERQEIGGLLRIADLLPSPPTFPPLLGWDLLENFELTMNSRTGDVTLR
jgi:hypothetical protein